MGFLDKVKEKAAEAIEQGKDVAQGQQLKLQLKKLEAEEEEALAAFGNAAFTLYEAGTLSMSSDLAAAAERIRTARTAIEDKKAEARRPARTPTTATPRATAYCADTASHAGRVRQARQRIATSTRRLVGSCTSIASSSVVSGRSASAH